jgi:hypothetical protein
MGSPISGLIAEIFLQHSENKHITQTLETKRIAFYTRYLGDILVIYDSTQLGPQNINTYVNGIHRKIILKSTHEEKSSIDLLDFTVTLIYNRLKIDIYRETTTTDSTINIHSNHPMEHKTAAYRHHINRMYTIPLEQDNVQKEWETIKQWVKTVIYHYRYSTNSTKNQKPKKTQCKT